MTETTSLIRRAIDEMLTAHDPDKSVLTGGTVPVWAWSDHVAYGLDLIMGYARIDSNPFPDRDLWAAAASLIGGPAEYKAVGAPFASRSLPMESGIMWAMQARQWVVSQADRATAIGQLGNVIKEVAEQRLAAGKRVRPMAALTEDLRRLGRKPE